MCAWKSVRRGFALSKLERIRFRASSTGFSSLYVFDAEREKYLAVEYDEPVKVENTL